METINIKGNWTALSPLHHGGSDTYGTVKLIHTQPTVVRNSISGELEVDNIPCIHGNAVRGMLRRLLLEDYLTQLDYKLDSTKAYHFMFTGGILEALDPKDKGSINLSKKKTIRKYIPPISLLGSAIGNQMIQGKVNVGMGEIVCSETRHYIENYAEDTFSAYNLKASDFGTRLDDLEDKLEPETSEEEAEEKEEKKTKKEKKQDGEQHTQMLYEFETIVRGTQFTHEFTLMDALPHEKGCFKRMLELWNERPYLGGKSGTGYGKISFEYNGLDELDSGVYLDYLNDNKEDITAFLDTLCKTLK